jgi:hypothetical protein
MAAAAGSVALPLSAATTVALNQKDFVQLVEMDDASFSAWMRAHKRTHLWDVYRVTRSAFACADDDKNRTHTTAGVRAIAREFPGVMRIGAAAASQVLSGNLVCAYCHRSGAVAGSFRMQKRGAIKHSLTSSHCDNEAAEKKKVVAAAARAAAAAAAAASAAVVPDGAVVPAAAAVASGSKRPRDAQQSLPEMGAVKRRIVLDDALRARALFTGYLVAAGVPYSTAATLMTRDMFALVDAMRSGASSRRTMHDTDMPTTVSMVKAYIKENVIDRDFAISIDGGAASLLYGVKVVAITIVAPYLPHDLLAFIETRFEHETGRSLADNVVAFCAEYGFDPKKLRYYSADNASVNFAAVKKLRKQQRGFCNLRFSRCLAHCLDRIIEALCEPIEDELGLFAKMRSISTYIRSGGSISRRGVAVEFGLRASGADSTDTRWASRINACTYMREKQSVGELRRALKRLQKRADKGDESAAAALEDVSAPMSHWSAAYLAIEDMDDEGDAKGGTVRKNAVLDFLVSPTHFGATVLVSELCKDVSMLFALGQAGPGYASKKASAPASEGVRTFRDMLEDLHVVPKRRDEMLTYVEEQIKQQQFSVRASTYADSLAAGAPVSVVLKARHTTSDEATRKTAMATLKKVLVAALKSAHTAVGHANLDECLRALKGKEKFNMNVKPEALPLSDTEMFILFDVNSSERSPSHAAHVRSQWKTHMEKWTEPAAPVSLAASWEYWESLAPFAPDLASIALDNLLKPDTSASVERIFSALTDMDDPQRQTMDEATLTNTLMLRCNKSVVEELVGKVASETRAAVRLMPQESAAQVERREAAFAAAASALAAAPAPAVVEVDDDSEGEGGGGGGGGEGDALMADVFAED